MSSPESTPFEHDATTPDLQVIYKEPRPDMPEIEVEEFDIVGNWKFSLDRVEPYREASINLIDEARQKVITDSEITLRGIGRLAHYIKNDRTVISILGLPINKSLRGATRRQATSVIIDQEEKLWGEQHCYDELNNKAILTDTNANPLDREDIGLIIRSTKMLRIQEQQ
ncbi:MAG: hypothetical protein U5K77_00025 [Candidatus Saccharibacteria bacterium]|nr:hypothetical protein [Candidatus Saccharibacteria bacterium]